MKSKTVLQDPGHVLDPVVEAPVVTPPLVPFELQIGMSCFIPRAVQFPDDALG